MPKTAVNGVELYWELAGELGEPLVLVHGSWGDHHGWQTVVPALAQSFRVLTYDRRGHSQSERPAEFSTVYDDAADLAALVEQMDLAPAHIIGNSFGAVVVLHLAAARPDLFRTLMVHEPPLMGLLEDQPAVLGVVQSRIQPVLDLLEAGQMEAGAQLFMETVAIGPGGWAQLPPAAREANVFNAPTFLEEERDPDSRTIDLQSLAGFSRPALLTQGETSAPFFPVIVDKVARALPQAQRHTFSGAGHVPYATHPEAYIAVLTAFIRQAGLREAGAA